MYTEKMNKQTQQISDYEYEISLLRKQLESLETEREKDKKKIEELEELLAKAREVNTVQQCCTCRLAAGFTMAVRRGVARNLIWMGINGSRRQNNHKRI